MGEEDLILLTKNKEEQDWNVETDLSIFGPLPDIDWIKSWPLTVMPDITSPPKGRQRPKNVHNLSRSSDEEGTPKKPKTNDVTSIAKYFNRRDSIKERKKNKV